MVGGSGNTYVLVDCGGSGWFVWIPDTSSDGGAVSRAVWLNALPGMQCRAWARLQPVCSHLELKFLSQDR